MAWLPRPAAASPPASSGLGTCHGQSPPQGTGLMASTWLKNLMLAHTSHLQGITTWWELPNRHSSGEMEEQLVMANSVLGVRCSSAEFKLWSGCGVWSVFVSCIFILASSRGVA